MEETSFREFDQGDESSKADRVLGRDGGLMVDCTANSRKSPEGTSISAHQSSEKSPHTSDTDSDEEEPVLPEIFYETLEEWQDIIPVPLAVGSVMPIAFTARFKSVFGYFRAILATGELSPRGLRLCEDAARLNPANYAVWMYRRKVLASLGSDLTLELQYISRVIEKNQKNYQVWYHRQKIVELLRDPSKEFDFTAKMLQRDSKNYHVWQYRQFVLRHFDILEHNELDFTDKLIRADAFNNSAWMQRYFVLDELPRACGRQSFLNGSVLVNEIQYTVARLTEQVHNESPWSYLRGILRNHWAENFEFIYASCTDLYNQNLRSPYLLAFMVDMFDEDITHGYHASTIAEKTENLQKIQELCSLLANEHDSVRKNYWNWVGRKFLKKFHFLSPQNSTNTTIPGVY